MKKETRILTSAAMALFCSLFYNSSFGQVTFLGNNLTGGTQTAPTQYVGSSNVWDVAFKTGGADRMRIQSSTGFVGIGTTTPWTALQVNGQSLWLTGGNATALSNSAGSGLRMFYDNTNNYASIFAYSYGSVSVPRDLILENTGANVGFVGVGITTPSQKLDVNGNISVRGTHLVFNSTSAVIDWGSGTGDLFFRKLGTQGDISSFTDMMTIKNNGNVGIGTNNPIVKLDVNGTANVSGKMGIGTTAPNDLLQVGTSNYNVTMGSLNANSTMNWGLSYIGLNAAHTASNAWKLTGNGNNGGSLMWTNTQGTIYFSNFISTGGADQTKTDQQIWDQRTMSIGWNGGPQVTIGKGLTGGPHTDYTLAVDGITVTKEVFVFPGDWADFVFNSNYKLTPINELGEYIKTNNHLPNVPTSDEVKKDGLNVGEMQVIQMQKIEELTLYIVQLQKQIDELKQQKEK